MKPLASLALIVVSLPMTALACPTGMVYDGNGCSPPYEYTGWDMLRDQRAAIDAIGSDRDAPNYPTYTPEKLAEFARIEKERREAEEKEREQLAKGLWHVDSKSTPEGNLCAATFAKYTSDKDRSEGGLVTIMGFQQPKQEAWLIFQGAELPKPRNVKKMKITLQQDDEPAQTVEVFNYKKSRDFGAVTFAVPSLKAAVDGMRDTQRFKLLLDGKTAMAIQWTNGAKPIDELRACAK
ncbi:hypothetical protein [Lysobacter capsici]|uniref:hypothetical protein n=1 Tax=Lysobacter capsici TaxID=435897 RepID=UPI001C007F7F|nr:hypothetical protein [Lysobacter capsici]QWF16942.1 hypothetical protein KME82_24965 [Lysobacter capsici]